jgi:aspartate kinase
VQNLRVQKYGGSSLENLDKIKSIAEQIKLGVGQGSRYLVVVSAMGETTDELLRLAHAITPHPKGRELDMLLTAGERISMALLSLALNHLEVPAMSFTGSQAGILTCGTFGDARILEVKPFRVEKELEQNKVVVIAGFQGVDPVSKEVTTLGRGGSDTTAIAMADYFKTTCEFMKDTEGVFTADPHQHPDAQHLPHLSWQELVRLTEAGAPFLHLKAARMAIEKRCPSSLPMLTNPKGASPKSKAKAPFERLPPCILKNHPKRPLIKLAIIF